MPPRIPKPFTVDHFRKWTQKLVLDNGERWAPEPFQEEFVADVFSGVAEIWLVVPEGNGKTTLLSGLALYHGDHREDAMVPMAAASRDQCKLLFGQAAGFVRRSSDLEGRFRVYEGYLRIKCYRTAGEIQVFAADERTGDGIIPTLGLLDELHRHKDMRLYRTWGGKLEKRDAQLAGISTAGEPGSEFEEIREAVRTGAPQIRRRGRHTRAASPEMILHDFALTAEDDPGDMATVKKANPFSGISEESLARKRASPTMTMPHWLRFVCNRPARTVEAAVSESEWAAAEADADEPEGASCDAGLDLGWKYDATAIVPLFAEEGLLLGRARVILPPRDGNSLRPERIQSEFLELHAEHPINRVVMDPSAGGEQLAAWLEDEIGCEVVSYSQTNQPMCLAYARFMEGLRADTLRHVRDPVLTRHVLNAVAKQLPDGTERFMRPAESRAPGQAPRREIDALIAASIVVSVAIAEASKPKLNLADYRISTI